VIDLRLWVVPDPVVVVICPLALSPFCYCSDPILGSPPPRRCGLGVLAVTPWAHPKWMLPQTHPEFMLLWSALLHC